MINLNNKHILITGGCGFIGSNFINYINKNYNNVHITNIDKWGIGHRKMTTQHYINNNQYNEIVYNLAELDTDSKSFITGSIIKNKYDYVFHFAAESHVDRSINNPVNFISENIVGIAKLLEILRLNQPDVTIINVSTDECYGHLENKSDPKFTENSILNPRSPYAASKASADLIANSYRETFNMNILTTRCCNNFGPHQDDEKFIPTVIRNICNKTPIPVYGSGQNIREWIYVDDHNKSILDILNMHTSQNNVYNISSGIERSNLELICDIGKIMDSRPLIQFVDDRKGHDFRYALTSNKYHRSFPLNFYIDNLKTTVKFYVNKYSKANK